MNIQEATDKAHYVEWIDEFTFAVWHGGHTVNFYSYSRVDGNVEPTTCINVGDYETGDVCLQDVKEGIQSVKDE